MTVGLDLHVRGDPNLDLDSDAVFLVESGTSDYEELSNLPSLNGTTLKGDLTSEDVGITASSLGVTAESLGITAESLGVTAESLGITSESLAENITAEDLGMSTAGTAKVLSTIFKD